MDHPGISRLEKAFAPRRRGQRGLPAALLSRFLPGTPSRLRQHFQLSDEAPVKPLPFSFRHHAPHSVDAALQHVEILGPEEEETLF